MLNLFQHLVFSLPGEILNQVQDDSLRNFENLWTDLFYGDALGQVSWLIDIQSFEIGHVVGQKLKGDGE